jgi:hypothetical protein
VSMMMFARAFSHYGEIERASRCRGTDMLYGGYSVVSSCTDIRNSPHGSRIIIRIQFSRTDSSLEHLPCWLLELLRARESLVVFAKFYQFG